MRTLLIALGAAVLDQLVKWIVQTHMELGQTIPLIKSVFHLTYILNPGAAFGLLPHKDWFFLAIVVVLYAAFFIMRKKIPEKPAYFKIPEKPAYFSLAIAMLLGGALGNAIDRVRIGEVIDFFDFRIWPIFNVADIFICLGVGLIAFYFWRHSS